MFLWADPSSNPGRTHPPLKPSLLDCDVPEPSNHAFTPQGQDVPPKLYGSWYAQTDAPPEGYIGPLAMQKFELDYGG